MSLGHIGTAATGQRNWKVSSDPVDISLEAHHAYEQKFLDQANRKSGEFARFGWWDNGSCKGDDQWACDGISAYGIGGEAPFSACASGKAVATESYSGDGKCIITWWKWVCK